MDTTSKAESLHPFNPLNWTAFTWLGALMWLWGPFWLNYIWLPVRYNSIGSDGEILSGGIYSTLAEIPFPWGWPFSYIVPGNPLATPIMVGAPPAPPSVEWLLLGANVALIVLATLALIYCLQKLIPKFSIMTLLLAVTLVSLYFGLTPLVSRLLGSSWGLFISDAVYFSPILGVILIKVGKKSGFRFNDIRSKIVESFLRQFRRPELNFDTPDDALALASKLDQEGRWEEAVRLYLAAAKEWPGQAEYVDNCIAAIELKKSAD